MGDQRGVPMVTAPGHPADGYLQVSVNSHKRMSCAAAVQIAARAYYLPDLKPIRGPQFGPGGWGGPFHVVIDAKCDNGARSLRFSTHSDFGKGRQPDPEWSGPLRTP